MTGHSCRLPLYWVSRDSKTLERAGIRDPVLTVCPADITDDFVNETHAIIGAVNTARLSIMLRTATTTLIFLPASLQTHSNPDNWPIFKSDTHLQPSPSTQSIIGRGCHKEPCQDLQKFQRKWRNELSSSSPSHSLPMLTILHRRIFPVVARSCAG